MEYSDDYLLKVLPPEDPAPEFVPSEINEEIAVWTERDEFEDPQLVMRSTRWTYAMFNELRLNQIKISKGSFLIWPGSLFTTSPFNQAAIGLFDPSSGVSGFGLIVEIPPFDEGPAHHVERVYFPRLEKEFPLLLRPATHDEHTLAHPVGGISAAWAKCNISGIWGILTAGHVVGGTAPGRSVALASGQIGTLARSYHPPIDAAFVFTPGPPTVTARLSIRRFPAAGHSVDVNIKSGAVRRTVVHVDSAMGVINTRTYPVQLYLNQPCSPGDSGALVCTTSGEATGVYLGSLKTPTVPSGIAGRALNFEQATFALDITAYM